MDVLFLAVKSPLLQAFILHLHFESHLGGSLLNRM